MKHIAYAALLGIAMLFLAGCDGNSDNPNDTSDGDQESMTDGDTSVEDEVEPDDDLERYPEDEEMPDGDATDPDIPDGDSGDGDTVEDYSAEEESPDGDLEPDDPGEDAAEGEEDMEQEQGDEDPTADGDEDADMDQDLDADTVEEEYAEEDVVVDGDMEEDANPEVDAETDPEYDVPTEDDIDFEADADAEAEIEYDAIVEVDPDFEAEIEVEAEEDNEPDLPPDPCARTIRINLGPDDSEANADASPRVAVSSDGRYVIFASTADNLAPGDTNGLSDVFRRDTLEGETEPVSANSSGDIGNGISSWPDITADGRFVAFISHATNLIESDTNGISDVFLRDMQEGTTTLISQSSMGTIGNGAIDSIAVSAEVGYMGPVVAFSSLADNLVPGDTNGTWDIFTRDGAITQRVSVSSSGVQANGPSFNPSLSRDGRYVAFESYASNLVYDDTNGRADIFVHDRISDITSRVSLTNYNQQVYLGDNTDPFISADGQWVAFVSTASDMDAGDTNGSADMYLRSVITNTTVRVSRAISGRHPMGMSIRPTVDATGRYVTYTSNANDIVEGDSRGTFDVFRFDRTTATTTLVSVANDNTPADGQSYLFGGSMSGEYIAFLSLSEHLVTGDSNKKADIFLRDVDGSCTGYDISGTGKTGQEEPACPTARLSENSSQEDANDNVLPGGGISSNGQFGVFASAASNLVPDDTNGMADIFIKDTTSNGITRINLGPGGVEANGPSYSPILSTDGTAVAFISVASNLVPGDTNGQADAFVYESGIIQRVSVSSGGSQSNGPVDSIDMTANGRFIAFSSLGSNIVAGDTNDSWDVFVYDRLTNQTNRVSINQGYQEANGSSLHPSISDDGQLIAYVSHATNLTYGDINGRADVFVYNRSTAATERISQRQGGGVSRMGGSMQPVISGDGTYVAFTTDAWDLFYDDFNDLPDVALHNRATDALIRISRGLAIESNGFSFGPSISSDGRYVAFVSSATNLIGSATIGDANEAFDVYRYDRQNGSLIRVSVAADGGELNNSSTYGAISADGNRVFFISEADNVTEGDGNQTADAFTRLISCPE